MFFLIEATGETRYQPHHLLVVSCVVGCTVHFLFVFAVWLFHVFWGGGFVCGDCADGPFAKGKGVFSLRRTQSCLQLPLRSHQHFAYLLVGQSEQLQYEVPGTEQRYPKSKLQNGVYKTPPSPERMGGLITCHGFAHRRYNYASGEIKPRKLQIRTFYCTEKAPTTHTPFHEAPRRPHPQRR